MAACWRVLSEGPERLVKLQAGAVTGRRFLKNNEEIEYQTSSATQNCCVVTKLSADFQVVSVQTVRV